MHARMLCWQYSEFPITLSDNSSTSELMFQCSPFVLTTFAYAIVKEQGGVFCPEVVLQTAGLMNLRFLLYGEESLQDDTISSFIPRGQSVACGTARMCLCSVQRAHAHWPAGKQFVISKLWVSFPMTSLVWKCLSSLQFSSNSEQLSSSPLFKLGRTWIRASEVTARMDNRIHTWGSFFLVSWETKAMQDY